MFCCSFVPFLFYVFDSNSVVIVCEKGLSSYIVIELGVVMINKVIRL